MLTLKVRKTKDKKTGQIVAKTMETVTGRVLFNEVVPEEVGYMDELLTKKKAADHHRRRI